MLAKVILTQTCVKRHVFLHSLFSVLEPHALDTGTSPLSHRFPTGAPTASPTAFTLNPPAPVKLSDLEACPLSSPPCRCVSPPPQPHQAPLDASLDSSLHEGQGETSEVPCRDPSPLDSHLRDSAARDFHDVSTLTELCSNLPELEIVSILSEGQPDYALRADSVFGYDHDDWLHTPLVPQEAVLGLSHEQIEETFKYFSTERFAVTMEVWSSLASEDEDEEEEEEDEDEDEKSGYSLGEEVQGEKRHLNSNSNNNNANDLCREVTQVLCSDRVGQVTKTYHDIKAVTHLLEEKERDLELAARIGQSLLKQNRELTARNEMLDEQLEMTKEEIAQLRHELSMRDDLLQFYAGDEEVERSESQTAMKRNESTTSLCSFVHYDFLHQKLRGLEDENRKLRTEADDLTTETENYEEQEQELMMVCVEELTSVNRRVGDLSEELARKVEDSLRQQEEISSLLAQIVDLQARCKGLSNENEELNQYLTASRESQLILKSEMKDLQDKYSQCEDMLREAREDIKNLRNKSLPNSTVQRYSALASVFPMDSLAAEIEGTFRKGLDSPAPSEYKNHPWRVFETVKVAKRLRSHCPSPALPGSSPPASAHSSCTSTPRTSYYGSDNTSLILEDKPSLHQAHRGEQENSVLTANPLPSSCSLTSSGATEGPKRLGQPGTPGGQDLETALRNLSARQQNHYSERPFFDVERERKLWALAAHSKGRRVGEEEEEEEEEGQNSSGFLTPNDSLASSSTGTNYSNGSSRHSCGSSGGSRSYLPDRLQIVKPLEGSATLHQWQQLAMPNLAGILQPRPGVLTKDFRELEVDMQHVYSLNDLEEDEPDLSQLPGAHGPKASPFGPNLPQTSPTHTITTCPALQHSLLIPSFSTSVPTGGSGELLSAWLASNQQQHIAPLSSTFRPGGSTSTPITFPSTTSRSGGLGLVKLLEQQGITASTTGPHRHQPPLHHHHHPHHPHGGLVHQILGDPPAGLERDPGRTILKMDKGRRSTFSLNLVEKLQSLGLHQVVAWGMGSRDGGGKGKR
ncbi:Trafficking kinesin-binding protein 1 [Merluccius polli]|uniref:Trafficking kinesin-binding protein 1 n=1 Tax=Merluccius polli TaxID=89951 RepID=A0AA47N2V9_MERPO|nr:Trafficking kinesin-binding protein 1 [Merluccius polli]